MTAVGLAAEIEQEAERIRTDGSLPPGFEESIRERFETIASDPGALEAEVAAAGGPQGVGPAPTRGARLARRALRRLRRKVGPRLRALERAAIGRAGRLGATAEAMGEVAAERVRASRLGALSARVSARLGGGHLDLAGPARSVRVSSDGLLGDEVVDRFLLERLSGLPPGELLVAEAPDGALAARLEASGLTAAPRGRRLAPGALVALARTGRGRLAALVVAGAPDRVTPRSARALVRLTADRLTPGGVVVVLSSHPDPLLAADPVRADLSVGRPLHPATWCHLFAQAGLGEVAVRDSADGSGYAVAARRPEAP